MNKNSVFIGVSLDGFIADHNGGLDFLDTFPNTEQSDMGYSDFMARIDALIMGRNSFETVCGFNIDWPYNKPVYVLSNTLTEIPEKFQKHAHLVKGNLTEVLDFLHNKGHHKLYIDGGRTIQNFLKEDRVDEMIITTVPVLLGGGTPLFGQLNNPFVFRCIETKIYSDAIVQNRFVRMR